jgi:hypothetical protein
LNNILGPLQLLSLQETCRGELIKNAHKNSIDRKYLKIKIESGFEAILENSISHQKTSVSALPSFISPPLN